MLQVRLGSPSVTVSGNGSVLQLQGQVGQGIALAPLTPPAHELEQPHPLYGQPHIQVQHGVLVKAPPGVAPQLTTLSHPGTPPDTPPVSASPPTVHMHRGGDRDIRELRDVRERDPRDPRDPRDQRDHRGVGLGVHIQPGTLPQDDMQSVGGMGWPQHSLRQEPLDLRPHCPQDQTPEPQPESWPSHHHFQELQHIPRHGRHPGEFCSSFFLLFCNIPYAWL